MTDLADRYRAIVSHYAKLAQNPATKDHAWLMVDKFVNEGLPKLRKAVEKEINASKQDRRQSA